MNIKLTLIIGIFLISCSLAYAQEPLHYWDLNEPNSSNTAFDSWGSIDLSYNLGTPYGSVHFPTYGIQGDGSPFSRKGTNNAYASGSNPGEFRTLSFWMKSEPTSQEWGLFSIHDDWTEEKGDITVFNENDGRIRLMVYHREGFVGCGDRDILSGCLEDPILDNEWHHIVYTINGTDMFVYCNGVLSNSTRLRCAEEHGELPLYFAQDSESDVRLLMALGSNNDYGTAWLDEVKLFNQTLTDEEVLSIYQYGNVTEPQDPGDPVPILSTKLYALLVISMIALAMFGCTRHNKK